MAHTHPKELLQLLERPFYNAEALRLWTNGTKKLATHIIRDSSLLGAREWYLARNLETALTTECSRLFLIDMEKDLLEMVIAGKDDSNPLSARAEAVWDMLIHLSGTTGDYTLLSGKNDLAWQKAWQAFTEMSVSLNGESDFSLSQSAIDCLFNYFGARRPKVVADMTRREIDNHIKAVFNKERELMKASKES